MVHELFLISKVIYCYKEMWIIIENDQTYMLLVKCILKDATVSLYTPSKISNTFFALSHTQEGREACRREESKTFLEEYLYW